MRLPGSLIALVAAVPLLAACGGGVGSTDGRPVVVASFYPLQYIAERVAGEHAEVRNLTSPGAEPHDLELSVPQTAALSDADLAFYEAGLQPAVDEAIEQNGPEHVLDVTDVIELAPMNTDASHDEGAEHAGESEAEHAEHAEDTGHPEHGDTDPHFWLDPALMVEVAAQFRDEMTEIDPDHAADYRAGFDELRHDLSALDGELEAGLADCRIDTVVVSHDAFGYLSKYGLKFKAINGLSPDAEPSPAHIARLHDLIQSHGVTTVFSETLGSKQMSESIAGDLGIATAALDPIEGLSDATAEEDYLSLMQHNLAALRKANTCS